MRLGVLGGTFNPVHYGHLRAAEAARLALGLDKVLFLPSGNPPLKAHDLVKAESRLRMVELAVKTNEFFGISDIELSRDGRSYLVDTARQLRALYPDAEPLYFIMGTDAFLDLPRWRDPDALLSIIDIALIKRPGAPLSMLESSPFIQDYGKGPEPDPGKGLGRLKLKNSKDLMVVEAPMLDISSTFIRESLRAGKSIKYLLPENVESFIMTDGLYTGWQKARGA